MRGHRPLMYTLDEHGIPHPCDDPLEWAQWRAVMWDNPHTRVGADTVEDVWISTVFLGTDIGIVGPPLLYETMAFCEGRDVVVIERYTCQADAVVGHVHAVQQARQNPHVFWGEGDETT